MKLNVEGHEMLTVVSSLLRAEHKFNCGITGLRKAEKMSMMIHVPVVQARQQPIKILKTMILDNRRITIREDADDVGISFDARQAIFKNVLGMKRPAAKIVPNLLNFP